MTTLWVNRSMTNNELLQEICELIYYVDPDAVMEVAMKRKYGLCRMWLTLRITAAEKAVAYVHGDLVHAGAVFVEEDDNGIVPIKAWIPQGNDIELRSNNLHRTQWKNSGVRATHPALAIGSEGLGKNGKPTAAKSPRLRRPRSRSSRSRSFRDLGS